MEHIIIDDFLYNLQKKKLMTYKQSKKRNLWRHTHTTKKGNVRSMLTTQNCTSAKYNSNVLEHMRNTKGENRNLAIYEKLI